MKKLYKKILLSIVAIILFLFPVNKIPYIDNIADDYFKSSLTQAGGVYATARIINASISVVQESSIDVMPAGIGVTIAAGQCLDPVNDLIEKLSDVMITSIASLVLQKIFYEVVQYYFSYMLSLIIIISILLSFFKNKNILKFSTIAKKITLLVILARFMLPLMALASESIDKNFFTPEIQKSKESLSIFADSNEKTFQPDLISSASNLKNKIESYIKNASTIADNILQILALYITLFVFQVIFLPLSALFIIVKFINILFNKNFPTIIEYHSKNLTKTT